MPDYRVDSIYDIASITAEQEKLMALLEESKKSILDLNSQRVNLQGTSVSSFTAASQELNKTISESNNITDKAVKARKELTMADVEARLATQQRTASMKADILASKAAEGSYDALNLKLKALIAQYKAMSEQERKSAGGQELQKNILTTNTSLKKLDEGLGNYQRNVGNYSSAFYNYALGLRGVRGPVKLLGEALGIGAQEADQFRLVIEHSFQAISAIFRSKEKKAAAAAEDAAATASETASETANTVATEANTVATEQNNTTKSTGSKIAKENIVATEGMAVAETELAVATTASSTAMKVFLNVLKFSGIALLVAGIGYIVYELYELSKASKETAAAQKLAKEEMELFNNVMKEADQNAGKQIADLKILYSATQDVTLSEKERTDAAQKLIDLYPETFKNFTTENILLGEAKDNYDALSTAIIKNAQAKAAANEIEKLEGARLDALNQKLKINNATLAEAARVRKKMLSGEGEGGVGAQGLTKALTNANNLQKESEAIQKRKNKALKEQDDIITGINAKEQFLIKLIGAGNLAGSIDDSTKNKKGSSNSLEELKARLNTEFDIYKINQEAKIRLFDKETKDENVYYLDKLTALDNYVKAEKELLDKEAQNEIDNAEAAAARETQHLQESKVGKSKPEQARIDQNIAITQQNLEQQILLIKAKYADLGVQVVEKAADERQKIIEKHLKDEQALYDEISKSEQKNIDDDNARIKKGFEDRAKAEEEAAKKKIELLKQLHQQEEQLAVEAGNFLYNLAISGYERQLNLITEQSKQITKTKDEQLAANDAIVQSAQDKAANVILINSRAQSQQDVLDRRAADIKNKEAKFERAQQIFDVGIQTIKALAQIKLQASILAANPLTAALAPLALAQIPIALATSALSIGAILAKPLPHYKGGRGEKGEEFAIVGDGGVNEFIWRGNGSIEKTPAINTLTHLMPKDKVYPNKQALMKELILNNMQLSNYSVERDGGINRNDIDRLGKRIENSISDIRIQTQLVTKSGWRNHNERLAKYDEWVNRVIKN